MRRRRFLVSIFALNLVASSFLLPVSAHPGKTDSHGGHKDHSTGEYHYHHGQPAHQHYDINGDGVADCKYNFKINESPSISSGNTSSVSSLSQSSYDEAYDKGYAKGKSDGYLSGKTEGYSNGKADGYSEGKEDGKKEAIQQLEQQYIEASSNYMLPTIGCTLLVMGLLAVPVSITRRIKNANKYVEMQTSYERKLRTLKTERDNAISQLTQNEDTIAELKKKYLQEKHNSTLLRIASGDDPSVQLPSDVRLRKSFSVIKGIPRDYYPYGDYTVFLSRSGRKYHCSHSCTPVARTLHFFDLPSDSEPCKICVPEDMYPQPRPDWYQDIANKLK